MSGLALLLREQGHAVSGCDRRAWPPVADLLRDNGIDCHVGYEAADLPAADCYVIGNVVSRGNPMVERILHDKLPFRSAPEVLRAQVLPGRRVIAIAGTHGKTSICALVADMLRECGLDPGWLIGGIPLGLPAPAHLGGGAPFVIEADEYDTAFFDKSAKFLHYFPDLLVINNLEFDHADIYPDLAAIQTQFHYLLRGLSATAKVLVPAGEAAIDEVLERGCWSQVETFCAVGKGADWTLQRQQDGALAISKDSGVISEVGAFMGGYHNMNNLLAGFATAVSVGADPQRAAAAAANFKGVRGRYELLLECEGVRLYDDFAHHPTAIAACIAAARQELSAGGRLLVAVDLASNSMKAGSHLPQLGQAVAGVDLVFWHGQKAAEVAQQWGGKAFDDSATLAGELVHAARRNDTLILFSNSHFGGLRQSLPDMLRQHLQIGK